MISTVRQRIAAVSTLAGVAAALFAQQPERSGNGKLALTVIGLVLIVGGVILHVLSRQPGARKPGSR